MSDSKQKMVNTAIYYISQLNKIKEDPDLSPTMKKMIRAYIKHYLKEVHDEMERSDEE